MVNVGDIVEGKVTGITSFGAFIQLEEGSMGLVHISEVADGYVKDIKDHLIEGQVITAKIISVERDGKLRLSIKKLIIEKPVERRFPEGGRSFDANYKRGAQNSGNKTSDNQSFQPEVFSFEDKLSRFMKDSDEKLSDLKKQTDNKRGGGYGRKTGQF